MGPDIIIGGRSICTSRSLFPPLTRRSECISGSNWAAVFLMSSNAAEGSSRERRQIEACTRRGQNCIVEDFLALQRTLFSCQLLLADLDTSIDFRQLLIIAVRPRRFRLFFWYFNAIFLVFSPQATNPSFGQIQSGLDRCCCRRRLRVCSRQTAGGEKAAMTQGDCAIHNWWRRKRSPDGRRTIKRSCQKNSQKIYF